LPTRSHALHGTLVLAAAYPLAGFMAPIFRDTASMWSTTPAEAAVTSAAPARDTVAAFTVPVRDDWALFLRPQQVEAAAVADAETPAVAEAFPSRPAEAPVARAPRTREDAFIMEIAPGAQQSQRTTGVPASVTIAQGILESYWGTSYLAREANNLFGVKAQTKPGPAGVVTIDAWEVENGKDVVRSEPFRKYESKAQSVADHGLFFIENRRYRSALEAKDDPREFARRINDAGYATDPAYAGKLIALMDRYDLYHFDLQ